MSMLDRRSRTSRSEVPSSTGPDEETVRIARKDFRKRRNAGRWRRARVLVAAVLVVALVAGAAWLLLASPYVTAQDVRVSGLTTVSKARVEGAANVPTGTPLARVDLSAIQARVESVPAVRRAQVSRSWPHTVSIAVTERVPVAVIDQGNGLKALDSAGVLFNSYPSRPKGLPLMRTDPDVKGDALVEGAKVIASLPTGISSRVDRIDVASVDQIQLVLRNGRTVLWGSADDSAHKAEVLATLLPRVGTTVTQIDVTVAGRPTTR